MSVIASIATYDRRAPHLRVSVASICDQGVFDRILVMVGSPAVADTVTAALQGLPCEACVVPEIGPGKKHLAATVSAPEDTVVTFDDDRIYPAGYARCLLEGLASAHQPTGLVGYLATSPLLAVPEGECDLLHGEYGWAYQASAIPTGQVVALGADPALSAHDDVYLGWLLAKAGTRCHVVADPGLRRAVQINVPARRAGSLGMSADARHRFWRAMQATWWRDRAARVGRAVPSAAALSL
jgi:hypothetical protein